ncbi:MAG TPA: ADP-forming succinate--CoA ligase subunit beta [Myxococcales bacterium LLY-WYZ-16_1]|nr:ADP-forming succinate--CoA ligase subunit beta [Myxococcales bacterium LLY-WYZ-16_1]
MKIHEYQAKDVLRTYGVPTARGSMVTTADDAVRAAEELGGWPVVVKAQIHAGGRGKAGGVKVCKDAEEVRAQASRLLGSTLVTIQTGPAGQPVRRLLVEQGLDIARELYFGLVLDRAAKRVVMMASSEGGMDIEEVARTHPDRIHKVVIDPVTGLVPYQVRKLVFGMGLGAELVSPATKLCMGLWEAYRETDATVIEINPLVLTSDGQMLALDAKMNFDDNALFRQPEIATLRDLDEEDPKEVEAKKFDLSYIALDGNVGCLVNGAGLAMATMDIIKEAGGNPANFLDVGGGADAEKVMAAFTIILQDPRVQAVLVNIFGGIMKCDVIAEGVIQAAEKTDLKVPVVVRLEGTNVEQGKKMLAESGLALVPADDMLDAAQKVVSLAAERGS